MVTSQGMSYATIVLSTWPAPPSNAHSDAQTAPPSSHVTFASSLCLLPMKISRLPRSSIVLFTGAHLLYPLGGHLAFQNYSEKGNLDADIDEFSTRTKETAANIESLKPSIYSQASAIRCHRKRQQALADDSKGLFLELETVQRKLDEALKLRRKLMTILLEKRTQVCHISFFLIIYFAAHFSTAWSCQRLGCSCTPHKFSNGQRWGSGCSHSEVESFMHWNLWLIQQSRSKWRYSSCKCWFTHHKSPGWITTKTKHTRHN